MFCLTKKMGLSSSERSISLILFLLLKKVVSKYWDIFFIIKLLEVWLIDVFQKNEVVCIVTNTCYGMSYLGEGLDTL